MSISGSAPDGGGGKPHESPVPPAAPATASTSPLPPPTDPDPAPRPRRRRVFRWQGIIPLLLFVALLVAGWILFSGRIVRATLTEAGTKALGAQLDIERVDIGLRAATVTLNGVALADPFDRNRNLFEVRQLLVEVEREPLLEQKLVIRRVRVADIRTGTRRATPAEPVSGGGFAPRALAEVQRFAAQFRVPLLSLTPFDTLKAIVLDPSQLRGVQAALALRDGADSVRRAIETDFANLRLQQTLDSTTALLTRLQNTDVRTLGISGARTAIADVRRARDRVDSARARVEALVADTRRGVDTLQGRFRAIDDSARADYQFARSLLKLPTFEGPEIGAALFGKVTIDRFQQAVYWATLAREHAPPGLLPRETAGPERLRRSGTTVQFVERASTPRFLVRRVDLNAEVTSGMATGTYTLAASDITTEPAIVKRPTLFAARRTARGSDLDSVRIFGSMDHLGARPRETVNLYAAGVKLPALALPVLPLRMDPGRGTSELRFVLDGQRISGRWVLRSAALGWTTDSARARRLNTLESLVTRALTGITSLDLTADVSGTLDNPRLAVRSNLDRQVADRVRAVVGEEVAAAQAKVRAEVDRRVEEQKVVVRAKIAEVRAEGDRLIADARTRLDEERRRLEERLRALTAGLAIPGIGP